MKFDSSTLYIQHRNPEKYDNHNNQGKTPILIFFNIESFKGINKLLPQMSFSFSTTRVYTENKKTLPQKLEQKGYILKTRKQTKVL